SRWLVAVGTRLPVTDSGLPAVPEAGRLEPEVSTGRRIALPLAIAVLYLAAHLPFLAPSLEDIDSINFALGLRHFDPALHQPHPPGYPIYMLLGHVSLPLIERVTSATGVAAEARALAIWSAVGGAGCIIAAWFLF